MSKLYFVEVEHKYSKFVSSFFLEETEFGFCIEFNDVFNKALFYNNLDDFKNIWDDFNGGLQLTELK